jgi:CDP-diacylglycerol--glycerol-3-phosphate 3-phosphatidyltransferase
MIFVRNLPLLLTALRLVVAPFLLPYAIVAVIESQSTNHAYFLVLIFLLICLTDFFDGYFARKFNQVTKLGRILDPLADKFVTTAALFALVWCARVHYLIGLILVLREYVVLVVRQYSLMEGKEIAVSYVAKIKTFITMMYLALMMLPFSFSLAMRFILSLPPVFLSLYSMADYLYGLIRGVSANTVRR